MSISPVQYRMGKRIRRLRIKRGMVQIELARKMNLGQATISEWEAGLRWIRPESFKKLAKILGTTIQYIMIGT